MASGQVVVLALLSLMVENFPIFVLSSCDVQQRFDPDLEVADHMMSATVLLSFSASSQACESACKTRPNCGAINLGPNPNSKRYPVCKLLSRDSTLIQAKRKTGWKFKVNKCVGRNPCRFNGECFTLAAGDVHCVCPHLETRATCDCPEGWKFYPLGERCYYASTEKLKWVDAQQRCLSLGANLATINSSAENAFVFNSVLLRDDTPRYFIGINDRGREGTFVWADGSPVNYINWYQTPPDNYKRPGSVEDQDCGGFFLHAEKWNDYYCSDPEKFICEADVVPSK